MKKFCIAVVILLAMVCLMGFASCAQPGNDQAPYIGENGNWYINGTDTGVSVRGPQGEAGKDAYQVWLDAGYEGDEEAFIEWLKDEGARGLSAYELYKKHNPGYTGSEEQWVYDLASGRLSPAVYDVNEPHIIINQVLGRGITLNGQGEPIVDSAATGSSHSFIELYNPTAETVNLSGWSVQVAEGATFTNNKTGFDWNVLELTGTIPSKHSFLIAATKNSFSGANHVVTDWDQAWNDYELPSKNIKVILTSNTDQLSTVNPFNIDGQGRKVRGYVDMIGVAGNDAGTSFIDGCEKTSLRQGDAGVQSKQRAIRRIDFADTDDNSKDLEVIDYRAASISTALLSALRPRALKDGAWENEPVVRPSERADRLIIMQVFGGGGQSDTAISHSFIELYNPTASPVSLAGYSISYSSTGSSSKGSESYWRSVNDSVSSGTLQFNLPTVTLPAGCSYLIRGIKETGTPPASAVPQITVYDFDMGNRAIDNRAYVITLKSGSTEINSMVVTDANNKHTAVRRTDFIGLDYQLYHYSGSSGNGSILKTAADWTGSGATDLTALRPRSLADGVWGM